MNGPRSVASRRPRVASSPLDAGRRRFTAVDALRSAGLLALGLAALATAGCAVKAYQREHLADPIMQFETDVADERREVKWLEAREGSTGGVGGAGGGCACN
jgi:hypothetical protein